MAEERDNTLYLENQKKIIELTQQEEEIKKQIKAEVDAINKAKKDGVERTDEELRKLKLKLKIQQQERIITSKIGDLHEDITDKMDKEQLLSFDILKHKKEIKRIDHQIKNLAADQSEEAKATVKNLKARKKLLSSVSEETQQAAAHAQAQQKISESLLGTLGLSVTALKNMKDQAVLFGVALKASLGGLQLILGALAALGAIVTKKLFDFAVRFRDELGASKDQAIALSDEMMTIQPILKLFGADSVKITKALTDNFGTLDSVSKETVVTLAKFEKVLGLSPEHTAKIMKNMEAIGGLSKEAALSQVKNLVATAQANKILPNELMRDLADNTEFFAQFAKDGGNNLAMAAIQAKKLGLNLSTTAKIADSLLDFESSIEKEMEAALLTGKQINYNKARQLALEGDVAGAAKEVVNQIGGQAELNRMNAIQRKALADSIGVSAEELSRLTSGKSLEIEPAKEDPFDFSPLQGALGKSTMATIGLTAATLALAAGRAISGAGGVRGLMDKFKAFRSKGGGTKLPAATSFEGDMARRMSTPKTPALDKALKGPGILSRGKDLLGKGKGLLGRAGGALGGVGSKLLGPGLAVALGGFNILKGMKSGDMAQAGGGLGGLIGTGLGAFGGPLGMFLGGIAGQKIGQLTGGLFNKSKSSSATPNTNIPQTDAEFNKARLDSMKSGDGRFSSVPLNLTPQENTFVSRKDIAMREFDDLNETQKGIFRKMMSEGQMTPENINSMINQLSEAIATSLHESSRQDYKENQEFLSALLAAMKENTTAVQDLTVGD